MHLLDGQDLELNCLINFIPVKWESAYVFWYRNNKLLNFDNSGRVHLSRDAVRNGSSPDHVLSQLRIRTSDQSDSGNYSCQLNAPGTDSTHAASVQVFVLDANEYASASQGIAFKDGSRLNPAKSWSSSAALHMQQRMLCLLILTRALICLTHGCCS